MPRVSVIIPTLNRKELLLKALESVFAQSFNDLEVIVVDNGSTDGTAEVLLKTYGAKIRYFYLPEPGVSRARNLGIKKAEGEFIAFLDSDDLWEPEKLEKQLKVLAENPGLGLVGCYASLIDEAGKAMPGLKPTIPPGENFREAVLKGSPVASTFLLKKECLVAEKLYFNEELAFIEDGEFYLRFAEKFPLKFIPEPLAAYRIHSQATTAQEQRNLAGDLKFIETVCRDFPKSKLPREFYRDRQAKTRYLLGSLLLKQKEYQAARKQIGKALKIYPWVGGLLTGSPGEKLIKIGKSYLACLLTFFKK